MRGRGSLPVDFIDEVACAHRCAGSSGPSQGVVEVHGLNGQIFRSRKGEAERCWNRGGVGGLGVGGSV